MYFVLHKRNLLTSVFVSYLIEKKKRSSIADG